MPWKLLATYLSCSKKDMSGRTFIDPFVSLCITIGVFVFFFICFVFVFREHCICWFICSVFLVAQQERYEWEDSCRLLCFTLRHSWRGRGVVTTNLPDCPTYYPLTKSILNFRSVYILKYSANLPTTYYPLTESIPSVWNPDIWFIINCWQSDTET